MTRLLTQRAAVRAGIGVAVVGLAVAATTSATAGAGYRHAFRAAAQPAAAGVVLVNQDYAAVSPAAGTFVVGLSGKKTTGLPKTMTPGYHTFVLKQLAKGVRDLNVIRFTDPTYNGKKLNRDFNGIFGEKFDAKAYHRIVSRSVIEGGLATQNGPAVATQFTLKLKPNATYIFDNSDDNGGPTNVVTKVTTTGPETATGKAPKATASISQKEYSFIIQGLKAGTQVVKLSNIGSQLHELAIGLITDPTKTEQDAVDALLNGGPNTPPPAWLQDAGFGGVHTPKDTEYLKMHLQHGGRYIFICFMPDVNSGGTPHVIKGMHRLVEIP